AVKSPAEIDLLRRGFRISERAVARVIAELAPGRTELEMVGTAQAAIYQGGGEYEAHPVYVLAGRHSTHAIGRPTHRRIRSGEVVQLNIGARVAGYSPSVGRPVFMGRITPEARRLFQQGLDLHRRTIELMKAGVAARSVVEKFYDYAGKLGCRQNLLYGPCHGLGLIEVERPWMEETSDYRLRERMTFQVDTFLYNRDFGLRWEDGVVVTRDGVEELSSRLQRIIQVRG
ncbi:MAG TPA: M24 family metallopeptidase, partial [bacterium]|nr:M24 family metallopeptidase [bacterium]